MPFAIIENHYEPQSPSIVILDETNQAYEEFNQQKQQLENFKADRQNIAAAQKYSDECWRIVEDFFGTEPQNRKKFLRLVDIIQDRDRLDEFIDRHMDDTIELPDGLVDQLNGPVRNLDRIEQCYGIALDNYHKAYHNLLREHLWSRFKQAIAAKLCFDDLRFDGVGLLNLVFKACNNPSCNRALINEFIRQEQPINIDAVKAIVQKHRPGFGRCFPMLRAIITAHNHNINLLKTRAYLAENFEQPTTNAGWSMAVGFCLTYGNVALLSTGVILVILSMVIGGGFGLPLAAAGVAALGIGAATSFAYGLFGTKSADGYDNAEARANAPGSALA